MPTLEDVLYRSGDLFLPPSVRRVLETHLVGTRESVFYLTYWSLIHAGSGILVGWILLSYASGRPYYLTGFYVHTIWELWQVLIKNTPYWTPRGQMDVLIDTALFMGGMVFLAGIYR